MAVFEHVGIASVSNVETTVFTSNSDSTIVLSLLCANLTASSTDTTCTHLDDSNDVINRVSFNVTVPANASLELLANKYILPSGHKITIDSAVSGALSLGASYVIV